jgi:hypothetical protein
VDILFYICICLTNKTNKMEKLEATVSEPKELSLRAQKALEGLNKAGRTPSQQRKHIQLKNRIKALAIECGLDWGVIKKSFFIEIDGDMIQTKDFGLVQTRSKEVLNSVKKGYNVSQNSHVIRLAILGSDAFKNLKVHMAGSLNGGRKVFIQLEIEGEAHIGGDIVKQYVTILDSNDGSSSLCVGIGDETASCTNQFFYFYKQGIAKFRHSANMQEKMKEIPQLIEMALLQSVKMANLYNDFQSTECSRDLAHGMVRTLLGHNRLSNPKDLEELSNRGKNIMKSLYENIYGEMDGDDGNKNQPKGENLWGLLSGVTRWTTHSKSAPRRENGRLEGIMMGNNYKANQKALNFILEEAQLEF